MAVEDKIKENHFPRHIFLKFGLNSIPMGHKKNRKIISRNLCIEMLFEIFGWKKGWLHWHWNNTKTICKIWKLIEIKKSILSFWVSIWSSIYNLLKTYYRDGVCCNWRFIAYAAICCISKVCISVVNCYSISIIFCYLWTPTFEWILLITDCNKTKLNLAFVGISVNIKFHFNVYK